MRIAIIGGAGFVGTHLVAELCSRDDVDSICIIDIKQFTPHIPLDFSKKCIFSIGNSSDKDTMEKIMNEFRPHLAIHLASWGMSGAPMIQSSTRETNLATVRATIDACIRCDCTNLIYTSTYNVVFGGQEVIAGDETVEPYPLRRHTDYYSSSKAEAEKLVLHANNKVTSSGKRLFSCAVRPAAIYGEGEQRHFPRIVKNLDIGIYNFYIGQSVTDWVHIENLVQAYVLLIGRLSKVSDYRESPAGQVYFISDGTPIKTADFFAPLALARDVEPPTISIPVPVVASFAYVCEQMYHISSRLGLPIEPFLTRAEVYKVGVTHHFSIRKAQEELGYEPKITSLEGSHRMAKYYESRPSNKHYFRISAPHWWLLVTCGLANHAYFTFSVEKLSNPSPWLQLADRAILTLFRSRFTLKAIWYWAIGMHAGEAAYAGYLSHAMGCGPLATFLWTTQTLALGYPSLRLLLRRKAMYPGTSTNADVTTKELKNA